MALAGKLAVVTGASSGIGQAIARRFAKEGASVLATGRNASSAASRLVNSAGVLHAGAFAAPDGAPAASIENFDVNFAANARAPYEMLVEATPHLVAAGVGAAVVNISSVNGKQSFATLGAYCGSKAAIDHIARCAAVDLAPHGVRVNNINPGVTVTPLQQRGGMSDEAYAAFLERSANVICVDGGRQCLGAR
ncbi:hypothetical protein JL722_4979 [Aureococcus anophagefferens]|nr:hypothetical protein JL722_4979 [Aureococcus anophagefferens]